MEKNWCEELMNQYDNWKDLVKDLIKDRLYDYEGNSSYVCDLAYTLFEGENIDGSFTYSYYWSKELIRKYWDDYAEIYEEYIAQCGKENSINVLEEPKRFVVVMLLEQAQTLLSNYDNKFINDNWNNEITLNKTNINKIIKSMEE